jgi:hypothetical protein
MQAGRSQKERSTFSSVKQRIRSARAGIALLNAVRQPLADAFRIASPNVRRLLIRLTLRCLEERCLQRLRSRKRLLSKGFDEGNDEHEDEMKILALRREK